LSAFRFVKYIGWPTITGLLFAACILLLFPKLQDKSTDENGSNSPFSLNALSPNAGNGWEGPASYSEAVRRATPAVVNIYTRKRTQVPQHRLMRDPVYRHFFNSANIPSQERMASALGSGVIINTNGYLLTNYHVVKGAEEIVVLLQDGREAHASLVGTDEDSDLAVLKITLDNLTAIPIGSPNDIEVGDVALAIGNPFGVGQTVTQGIISAKGRFGLGLNRYENFIQTDAAINPGSSGGALVDAYGNLVGINTAVLDKSNTGSGNSVGIGFAIPADTAINALNDIVEHGRVVRGWLGIEARPLSPQQIEAAGIGNVNGMMISAIYSNGPAHKAGLLPGDVITHINQKPVSDGRLSMLQVAQIPPGEDITIKVMRSGTPIELKATMGTRPLASS